jgi:hypothetical protein
MILAVGSDPTQLCYLGEQPGNFGKQGLLWVHWHSLSDGLAAKRRVFAVPEVRLLKVLQPVNAEVCRD